MLLIFCVKSVLDDSAVSRALDCKSRVWVLVLWEDNFLQCFLVVGCFDGLQRLSFAYLEASCT